MSGLDSGPPGDGLSRGLNVYLAAAIGSLLWQFTSRAISQTMDFTTGTDPKSR